VPKADLLAVSDLLCFMIFLTAFEILLFDILDTTIQHNLIYVSFSFCFVEPDPRTTVITASKLDVWKIR
jgi:hypothetical protein